MIAARIRGFTRAMGKDQPEYRTLYIRDERTDDGNVMVSAWEPTKEQLDALNAGGKVMLGICGVSHPPIKLWVEPFVEEGEATRIDA